MENNAKQSQIDNFNDNRLAVLSDGKLRTEDGCVFDIHKFALAKSSKYFTAIFCGADKDREDILIPGVRGAVMDAILSFIYTGDVSVKDEMMSELMITADYLLLDDLLSCLRIVLKKNLSPENCFSFYVAAQKVNRYDVLRECHRFVETHFESALRGTDEKFSELSLESLEQLLSDRNLCVSSEKTVFIAILKWVMADKLNRQRFVPDLLMCLSIADISEDLASTILENDIVVNNPFCQRRTVANQIFENFGKLGILRNYIFDPSKPLISHFTHRLPAKLHCIAYYSASNGKHSVQFFVTYDENIDLWRKISEIEFSPKFLTCIDDFIYMLKRDDDRNFRYSITENQWYELDDFLSPRRHYVFVVVEGQLYALGGVSEFTGEEVYDVEIYDSEFGVWYHTEPMIPISAFAAASLDKSIYVVGLRFSLEGYEMVAQVYHTASERWNLLPPVSVRRSHFALVAYLGKVYVIGGINDDEYLKDVEMFDPAKHEWQNKAHLPYVYNAPKAIVLNDLLIVYDNHLEDREYLKTNPPVFWNVQDEDWEQFEESSSMNKLHLYQFLTIDNREIIASVTAANRKPGTCFERSHFD